MSPSKKRKAKGPASPAVETASATATAKAGDKKSTTPTTAVAVLGGNSGSNDDKRAALHAEIDYTPLTLQDIHDRLVELCRRVPKIPSDGFRLEPPHDTTSTTANGTGNSTNKSKSSNTAEDEPGTATDTATDTATISPPPHFPNDCPYDKTKIRAWAAGLQHVLEEFHLLVALVSAATYRWASERSGAADQHLALLGQELARSQENIIGRVHPRIHDVLAPVVSVVTHKTVTTTTNDNINDNTSDNDNNNSTTTKIQQNYYVTIPEDIDYVNLCHAAAARNAASLRQVVLANFDKLLRTVQDYLEAQNKDSQHDVARGFVY